MLTGNEMMSVSAGSVYAGYFNLGSVTTQATTLPYYEPATYYWNTWYPSFHLCNKSKTEQAFKIVGKLMENKIIKADMTVKEFVKLVNEVAELL